MSGSLDIVVPTYALTACQGLSSGQRLQLIGSNVKQEPGDGKKQINSEIVKIFAVKEDTLVTFKLDGTSMGSMFKSKLSQHWKCEITSVTMPDESMTTPDETAVNGMTGDRSTLLDRITSGVDIALDNASGIPKCEENEQKQMGHSDDGVEDPSYECAFDSCYLSDELNTPGMYGVPETSESMELEPGQCPAPEDDEYDDMHDEELDPDLSSYETEYASSDEDQDDTTCYSSRLDVCPRAIVNNEQTNTEDPSQVTVKDDPDSASSANEEEDTNSPSKEHKCPICGKTFPYLSGLVRHSQIHYRSNLPRNRKRMAKAELQSAKSDTVSPRRQPDGTVRQKAYCCEWCGGVFSVYSKFRLHIRSHQRKIPKPEAEKRHACSTCSKRFSTPGALKLHQLVHTGERSFPCSICKKAFQTSVSCQMHMRIHTGEKPHVCSYCGRGFTQKCSLLNHINTHTGERPYRCDVCGKHFTQQSTLTAHKLIHTGEKPYICPYCGLAFATGQYRAQHVRIHKGVIRFTCAVCGKGFLHTTSYETHKRTHTGEKPYSCSICGKSFNNRSHVARHERIHTGEKPFQCQLCGESFAQNECLKKHKLKHQT